MITPRAHNLGVSLLVTLGLAWAAPSMAADHDIAFLAEHLAESAMDQRFASLPLRHGIDADTGTERALSLAGSQVRAGGQRATGPLLAIGASRPIGTLWRVSGHVFYDRLNVSGDARTLPLIVPFASGVPLSLPASAVFGGLDGTMRDWGAGIFLQRPWQLRGRALQLDIGLEWQSLRLVDYATSYRIVSGPSAGIAGTIDFSGRYTHVSPMIGLSSSWLRGNWRFAPHALVAAPFPRRGVVGRITGPGFDLAGDSSDHGFGKHFGDPYLVLGFEIEYRPWRTSLDVGAIAAQQVIEPAFHRGVDRTWLASFAWHW